MKAFIINLPQDVERKAHMRKLLDGAPLEPEFIQAVDGKSLPDISKYSDRQKCLQELKRLLAPGEIGAALSHKKAYKKIIDQGLSQALILEDDVVLTKDLEKFLQHVDDLPSDWEVVLLTNAPFFYKHPLLLPLRFSFWFGKTIAEKFKLKRPAQITWGAYGYLISQKGAKKLYNRLETIEKPIDWHTGNDKEVNVYILKEPLVLIDTTLHQSSRLLSERIKMREKAVVFLNKGKKRIGPLKMTLMRINKRGLKLLYNFFKPLKRYK